MRLDPQQLTNLIGILGDVRAHMLDGRPKIPLEGHEVRTVYHPGWYIQAAKIDGALLAFDHPAFDAPGFAIPRLVIAQIVQILNGHLTMSSLKSERRN